MPRKLKVLVGCECSGTVRNTFAQRGWDAWSVDIKPSETEGQHIIDDLFSWHLEQHWDLLILHPPCTYLSTAGACWKFHPKHRYRSLYMKRAAEFFMRCVTLPFEHIAIENPSGVMSTLYRKPDQYISPTKFGHRQPKRTALWLKNLPNLQPTKFEEKEVLGKTGKRAKTWLDVIPKGEDRQTYRSRTFQGIADAMADQWGHYIECKELKLLYQNVRT